MIPLWLKLAYSVFVAFIVPVYAKKWGWGNFLWFSDIALLLMVPALWLESRWLVSMMAVGVLLPESFWIISFFYRLLTGKRISGLPDYMFDAEKPLWLRALSLFHVFLPVLMLWMLVRLGYEPLAWLAQTALAWIVLPLSYLLTDPKENVNWVYGISSKPQNRMPPLVYLGLVMICFPVAIYWPTHLVLKLLFSGEP
jgi:hypothetical protein